MNPVLNSGASGRILKRIVLGGVGMDAHLHFRDGHRLQYTVPHTTQWAGYGIVMPNLPPSHVISVEQVLPYRDRILEAVPKGLDSMPLFTPLMTVSLTKDTTPEILAHALACEHVYAVKLYAGHTTNADGIDDIRSFGWAIDMIARSGKPLLLHGEAGIKVDIFKREPLFYETFGEWLIGTGVKMVCEHISTKFLVDFVRSAPSNVAATITAQHLLSNRNDMLTGGAKVDMVCLPILKRESDRVALLEAATSGDPKFFLGTDSAPHPKNLKQSAHSCCGCYTAPHALELYAEAFDSVGALDMLPLFALDHGLLFYGLQPKPGNIVIEEVEPWEVPQSYDFGDGDVVVPYMPVDPQTMRLQTTLRWKATRV